MNRYVQIREYVYDREAFRRAPFETVAEAEAGAALMNDRPEVAEQYRWEPIP